jgi:hypothetical protein
VKNAQENGMQTHTVDPQELDTFLARALGDLWAGYGGVMVSLGHKLGLYRAMADAGPLTARELAARAGCAERYVQEWLNAQGAGATSGTTPSAAPTSSSPSRRRRWPMTRAPTSCPSHGRFLTPAPERHERSALPTHRYQANGGCRRRARRAL